MAKQDNHIIDQIIFQGGMDQDSDQKYIQKNDYRLMLNGIKSAAKSHEIIEPLKGTTPVGLSSTIGIHTWIKIAGSVYDYKNGGIILLVKTDNGKSIIRYKEDGVIQALIVNNSNLNFEESTKVKLIDDLLIWQEREQSTQIINIDDALNDVVTYDSDDKLSLVKKPPLYTIEFGYGYDSRFHGSNVFRRMFQFRQQYIYRDSLKSCFGNTSDIAFNEDVFDIEDNVIQKQDTQNFIDIQFNSGDETVEKIRIAARDGNRGVWFEIVSIDKANPYYVHSEEEGSASVSYQATLNDNTDYYFRFFNTGGYSAIAREEIEKAWEFIPIQSDSISEVVGNRLVMGQNVHDYEDVDIGTLNVIPLYNTLAALSDPGVYHSIKRGRYYQGAIRILDKYGRGTEPLTNENLKFYVEDFYDTTNKGRVQLQWKDIGTVSFPTWAYKYQFLLTSPYIPFVQVPILYADEYMDENGEKDGSIALLIGFNVDSITDTINDEIEELKSELKNIHHYKPRRGGTKNELKSRRDEIEKQLELKNQELGNSYKRALSNLRQYEINRNDRIRVISKDFTDSTDVDQVIDLQILEVADENYYKGSTFNKSQPGLWLKVNSPEINGYTLEDILNSKGSEWTEVKDVAVGSMSRIHATTLIDSDDDMYVIGGFGGALNVEDPSVLNDVWHSDDGGETWTEKTDSAWPVGRAYHASVIDTSGTSDKLYVIGGYDTAIPVAEIYYSTDKGATWTLQNINSGNWSARYQLATVITSGSYIYILGGITSTVLNDVWYSNDGGLNWTEVTSYGDNEIWPARRGHAAVVDSNDRIFVMGGIDENGEYLNDVWYSDDPTDKWIQVTDAAGWDRRSFFTAVVDSYDQIYVMGGVGKTRRNETVRFNDVWYSNDGEGKVWTQLNESALWSEEYDPSAVINSNNVIFLIAGVKSVISRRAENQGGVYKLPRGGDSQWMNSLIEIYKPAYSDFPNRFYEISGLYDYDPTNTPDIYMHPANCFVKKQKLYSGGSRTQKGDQVETWVEDAHLTHDFKSDDYTIGRAFVRTNIEKGLSHPSIVYTNPHFIGTEINGLSQADYTNITYLSDEHGSIYSLQNQAGILKVIQAHKITAFYQTENAILGQKHEFQSNYGSVHPSTIVQSPKGYIYGFDVYRQTPWRDTGNGVHPLAGKASLGANVIDYKMEYFFNRMSRQLRERGSEEGSNDVVAGFDVNENFYYLSFVNNIEDETSTSAAGMGTDYYNTVIFSEHDNRWIGFVDIIPQKYAWGGNMLLSSNEDAIWLHNSDDANRLSFYGSPHSFIIDIVSNEAPGVIKIFNAIRLHSSVKMTIDPITIPATDTSTGREMKSKLSQTNLEEREGVYRSPLLKNMKTTSDTEKRVELLTGESLRGYSLQLRLTSDATQKFELFKLDILAEYSY